MMTRIRCRKRGKCRDHACEKVLLLTLDRAGGVIIVGTGGRITINNTLEERLKLLGVDALPQLRLSLFGENQNRRFTD